MQTTKIFLDPSYFQAKEKEILIHEELSATTFIFESGVLGLRMKNEVGEIVVLPYQGMQIWSAKFLNRDLTMKSMFPQPRPTQKYLETYGGFLLHCGFTAMGVPSGNDTHPLHGELPNAPYENAYLLVGKDDKGTYIALGGQYQHTVAFSDNYLAEPLIKLYQDSSIINVSLSVTNLKKTPMEYMYLAHINFRPVDHADLHYSALVSPETVRVRTSIPSHIHPGPDYQNFLEELARHPEKHNHISPDLAFDPEVVFFIDYLADAQGWAHTMQVHSDGTADYVRHRPSQLDIGVRWISRTPDQDAMGMILPATAEPEGYSAEKVKGNVKVLSAGGNFFCEMDIGTLMEEEAQHTKNKIDAIVQSGG